jgi:putative ABC transport system substrate-binding protein
VRELGYVDGKNLVFVRRYAEGKYERLPAMATELVQSKVDIILSFATPPTLAAQKATSTIPIVFSFVSDPVSSGIVASLARPGGNITGVANLAADVASKHLDLLLGVAPKVSKIAVLVNPSTATDISALKLVQAAAQNVGKSVLAVKARTAAEIESGFMAIAQHGAGAVLVAPDALFYDQRRRIAELAAKNRLPSIGSEHEYADAGCLLSYGANTAEMSRLVADYLAKILRGARPADLPVQQPTKLDPVINMKTAKALGITIPQSILLRAERVIE